MQQIHIDLKSSCCLSLYKQYYQKKFWGWIAAEIATCTPENTFKHSSSGKDEPELLPGCINIYFPSTLHLSAVGLNLSAISSNPKSIKCFVGRQCDDEHHNSHYTRVIPEFQSACHHAGLQQLLWKSSQYTFKMSDTDGASHPVQSFWQTPMSVSQFMSNCVVSGKCPAAFAGLLRRRPQNCLCT